MTTPFKSCGNALIEKGISALPIAPGQKYPARFDGSRWHPLKEWDKYGQRYANEAELDAWESWPDCGIGITLGAFSGVVVLDIDTDDPAIIAAIEAITPPSLVRKKGSQGYAAFYRHNGEHTQRISAAGKRVVEILSDGTQTVLPPSLHPNGERYQWLTVDTLEGIDLADLPVLPIGYADNLAHALTPWQGEAGDTGSGMPVGDEVPDYQISAGEFAELRKAVMHIPADDRDQWVKTGMCLRTIGGEGFELWREWSSTSDKFDDKAQREMPRIWDSFKTVDGGLTYESIYKDARRHGYESPPLPDYAAQLMQGLREREKKAAKTGFHSIKLSDLGALKPPSWLIKKHIIRDSLAMLYGPSGVGKSFVALDMGLCVATGKPWQGHDVKQGLVYYMAGEGATGINTRALAWCQAHNVDPADVPFYVSSAPVPLLDGQRVNEMLADISTLPAQPVLIIIDTLNRNFGDGDENTTKDMTVFVESMSRIQTMTGACVQVVHHTGKGDSELARGNSSLRAAMDTEKALKHSDGGIRLVCTKQKDAAEFPEITFDLDVLVLGVDEDGEEITSCVIVPSQATSGGELAAQLNKGFRVGKNQRVGLEILRQAVTTQRAKDPQRTLFSIERRPLMDGLEAHIKNKQRRSEVVTWLISSGVLRKVNRLVFEINVEPLQAALAGV